jgi:hypothetical protein
VTSSTRKWIALSWACSLSYLLLNPYVRQNPELWIGAFLISIPGGVIAFYTLGFLIWFFERLGKWLND